MEAGGRATHGAVAEGTGHTEEKDKKIASYKHRSNPEEDQ
jgi:hypothetical protein